jgi:hypothetical protein
MLNTAKFIYLPQPTGGCYLIAHTLTIYPGDVLFGASANNPNINDPKRGVILRLAPHANVPLLRTFDALDAQGGGNEYFAIENLVFDGNGSQQTSELTEAAVDWRGTFVETYINHCMITNVFGPALFTGSTKLSNLWIINITTSTYAWAHNPGQTGRGAIMADQVYVEDIMRPQGGFLDAFGPGAPVNSPQNYGRGISFNGLLSATINQLHCESVSSCIDMNDIYGLTIQGISGDRIGNPASSEPSDQYLMRGLNANIANFTFSAATFDQSGTSWKGNFPYSRVFGLLSGIQTNDIYQTSIGRTVWPFYTHGTATQGWSGTPYLGENPTIGNELYLSKMGQYSPNRVAIFSGDPPYSDYSFLERNGNTLSLGFSPGPLNVNEDHMLQLNYFGTGNPNNSVTVNSWIQSGVEENTDMWGELVFQGGQTECYPFHHSFTSHPECTVTPQFDIGPNNRIWMTYSGQNLEVHVAIPVTGRVTYSCGGRN